MNELKKCVKCEIDKNVNDFYKYKDGSIYIKCKECRKKHQIELEKKYGEKNCEICGKIIVGRADHIREGFPRSCSIKCKVKLEYPRVCIGRTIQRKTGYIYILSKEHPSKNNRGYVFEHRLVMEKNLGRYLEREEVVHHINKDKSDNRIENLMLFPNSKEHLDYHRSLINYL